MALPVVARYFCEVSNAAEVVEALSYAKSHALNFWVLGGGSNVIFADNFDGLIVHVKNQGIEVLADNEAQVVVRVAAGMNWDDFLQYCLSNAWYGLENLAIIPGTVGAAPIQNIGAYGQEVSECVESVEVVDVESLALKQFDNAACVFAYRDSLFKHLGLKQFVITSVTFCLQKQFTANLSYQVLNDHFADRPITASALREAVIDIRRAKLPEPADIPNTGSFFKNPVVSQQVLNNIQQRFDAVPHYPQANGEVKLAAGWLIEQAGFKGKQLGPVSMYEKQALVLVNNHGGSSADVLALANSVKLAVKEKFSVELEQEPIVVG